MKFQNSAFERNRQLRPAIMEHKFHRLETVLVIVFLVSIYYHHQYVFIEPNIKIHIVELEKVRALKKTIETNECIQKL